MITDKTRQSILLHSNWLQPQQTLQCIHCHSFHLKWCQLKWD